MADLSLYFTELVGGTRRRKRDRLLLALLKFASYPYRFALRMRALGYRLGLLRSRKLPRPVISVGNITLGGTGKTPMAALLAQELIAKGVRVALLSRGYGGSARGALTIVSDGTRILVPPEVSGDEPNLLAQKIPGLMVVIGADRYQAGLLALRELNPDLFILDDGFQHLRLQRDLNILLLDAARPFADGCTLPGGFLRESPSAAERADLVVYTRSTREGEPNLFPAKPSLWTGHRLAGLAPLGGGAQTGLEIAQEAGARITAFSGIAKPEAFFDLLEAQGVRLTATLSFPDHTPYGEEEIAALCRLRDASRSTLLITTEKDAVKLLRYRERLGCCYSARLEIDCADRTPLDRALEKLL